MIDFRPILFVLGFLLLPLAAAMALPAIADVAVGNPDWQVFAVAAGGTLFVGVTLTLTARCDVRRLNLRQAFLLTTLSWIALPAFAALPFTFADMELSYTDAYFEAMSGLTTTGSTVITGLDRAPPGILLWRALLQWLGGIGIIAVAIAILPMLQVGGMQLFRMESSDRSEKALPRTAQLAAAVGLIYLAFTALCLVAYRLAGMTLLEATVHAMTTISTGGFSTRDASIAGFRSPLIESIGMLFMVLGGTTFILFVHILRGRPHRLLGDSQVRTYAAILAAVILALALWRWGHDDEGFLAALRSAGFNVISVMTTTGYASADYGAWTGLAGTLFFLLTFVGGCSGSTSGGIKVFRFIILFQIGRNLLKELARPHGVHVSKFQDRPITPEVATSVMGFLGWWAFAWGALSLALAATGLDLVTSLSGAATALANVGPGLGDVIGPTGNFAPLPDAAKWVLSFGMVLGRLELLTVLAIVLPSFWRD